MTTRTVGKTRKHLRYAGLFWRARLMSDAWTQLHRASRREHAFVGIIAVAAVFSMFQGFVGTTYDDQLFLYELIFALFAATMSFWYIHPRWWLIGAILIGGGVLITIQLTGRDDLPMNLVWHYVPLVVLGAVLSRRVLPYAEVIRDRRRLP